jgi:threonine aldolase
MGMVIAYEGTVQEFVWRNEEKHEKQLATRLKTEQETARNMFVRP